MLQLSDRPCGVGLGFQIEIGPIHQRRVGYRQLGLFQFRSRPPSKLKSSAIAKIVRSVIRRDCSRSPELPIGAIDTPWIGRYSTLAAFRFGKPAIRMRPSVARVNAKISILGGHLLSPRCFSQKSAPSVADAMTAERPVIKSCWVESAARSSKAAAPKSPLLDRSLSTRVCAYRSTAMAASFD